MTLNQTLAIAFERNPTFGEFAANREAARAEVIQALAYPNPEIEGSLGEATGRESPKTTKAEYGLSLVQPIESPLKRRTRRAAAEALEAVALREEDVFRVTLRSDTAKAYFTILYRQRAVGLAEAARQIAEDIEVVVTRRVDSGEAPEIDRIKARVEVLKASRAVQSEKRLLASARAVLRALCGDALPDSFQVADSLGDGLEAADAMQFDLEGHPILARLQAERSRQEAVIAREKAAWRPDLKPGLSLGRQIDTDTAGVTLGIEIPIWNRNRGG
ncbi:TolC family protein, partial [Candidatus Sumerlaeota bacterium]|nr:TolC family protein [Candidatus Sumerlaeota bacterium]